MRPSSAPAVAAANSSIKQAIDVHLTEHADPWPDNEKRLPPDSARTALDAHGPWSCTACGVRIGHCPQQPEKGRGVFATRRIASGAVVGCYWGELLTGRQHYLRHGSAPIAQSAEDSESSLTFAERASLVRRRRRLSALTVDEGAPMGGADNKGAYSINLLPSVLRAQAPEHVAVIDAEDPNLSSWCRYVNHSAPGSSSCNCAMQIDGRVPAAWFIALRDIEIDEELAFDYGEGYVAYHRMQPQSGTDLGNK